MRLKFNKSNGRTVCDLKENTDRVNIMNPKYFIMLKWQFLKDQLLWQKPLKNIIAPFITRILTHLEPKLVDYALQNRSLKFLGK